MNKKDFTLDSSIALQKPFTEPVEKETTYLLLRMKAQKTTPTYL